MHLGVHHGQLPDQGADVDEEVEPVVDALRGDGRVDDDALAALEGPHKHALLAQLLHDQAADVGLEATRAKADDDDGRDQATQRGALADDHGRDRRQNEDDVAEEVDSQGCADGLVPPPFGVGHPRAEQRHEVLPELVEDGDACRGALTHSQGAGLRWVGACCRAGGKRLLDEVGDFWSRRFLSILFLGYQMAA